MRYTYTIHLIVYYNLSIKCFPAINFLKYYVYIFQNQVILTEGELRNNLGDSEKVRDLQDVVADLKAEVRLFNAN